MASIIWYTKRQATIESAVFGADFVTMEQAMEVSRGLRYKLRMMEVSIEGPTHMYGAILSTIHNTQQPVLQLKKKFNSICFHAVREAVAMGELLTEHAKTEGNPIDILNKVMDGGIKMNNLMPMYLYDRWLLVTISPLIRFEGFGGFPAFAKYGIDDHH